MGTRLVYRWLPRGSLLFALAVGLWPAVMGLDLTVEDGYFYLRIAQNLAQGAGSTFDGLHPTNGYHPLWLLCLVPVFRFAGDPVQALSWAHVLQGLVMAAACGVLYRTASEIGGRIAALMAVLGWIALTFRVWWSGLEFSLHALCLVVTLYVSLRWFASGVARGWAPYLLLGLSLCLTLLARLDTVLLAVVLYLGLLVRLVKERRVSDLKRWAVSAGLVVSVLVVYLGVNRLVFGHPLPVSAVIKRSWSAELLAQDPLFQSHGWLVAKVHFLVVPLVRDWTHPSLLPVACGLLAAALWLGIVGLERGTRRRFSPRGARARRWNVPLGEAARSLGPLAPWVAYAGLQYLVYSLSFHGSLRFAAWYYLIQPLLAALLFGVLIEKAVGFRSRRSADQECEPGTSGALRAVPAVAVLTLTLATSLFVVHGLIDVWRSETHNRLDPLRQAADWSRRNLPPGARIGSFNPGTLAYFSQRQVIALDGLVNSWEFATRRRHDMCRYWRQVGITHLVDLFAGEQAMAPVPTRSSYAACQGDLELLWREDRYSADWSLRAYRLRPDGEARR